MKHYILTVKDAAAELYMRPMYVQHPRQGIRTFENEIKRADPGNPLYTNPSDFELYLIGTWDDTTCVLELQPMERIARGADYMNKE